MAALSMLSTQDRLAFASAARRTFGGRRDIMKVLGYSESPRYEEFWTRYKRQSIAARVINLPVDQTWGGGEIAIKEWPEWEALNRRLEVQSRLTEVDRLASIGEFAVLLIGVKEQEEESTETDIARALEKPVERLSSLDDILYLQQYPQNAVSIYKTQSNPTKARFGKPEIYEITIASELKTGTTGTAGTKNTTLRVHYSRVLHVTPNRILNDVLGTSRLLPILDNLHDLDKVVGGSAEMFWQGADRAMVLSTEGAAVGSSGATSTGSADTKTDLHKQAEELAHGLRRFLHIRNGEVKTLESVTPDPSGIAGVLLQLMAAGSDIPLRILVGSERGELASTQDRANFADTITNRRSNYAQPQILMAFLAHLAAWGVAPNPANMQPCWPPIESLSAIERSQNNERTVKSMAEAEKALALAGGLAFAPADYRHILGFEGDAPSNSAISGAANVDVDELDPDVQEQFNRGRRAA